MFLIIRLVSLLFTAAAFLYYVLGMLSLNPIYISGLIFFIALLVTIRLFTPSGRKTNQTKGI
jgi:hypothetical protein